MAPVSRCDLRLPCTKPRGSKSTDGASTSGGNDGFDTKLRAKDSALLNEKRTRAKSSGSDDSDTELGAKDSALLNAKRALAESSDPDSVKKLRTSDPAAAVVEPVDPGTTMVESRFHKSQEFSDEMSVDVPENVPEAAHEKRTRDSAEVVEEDSEFRTALTRDSYEAERHAGHEIGGDLNAYEILRRCRAEVEAATADGECEQMACPSLDRIGTPGDVCAQFCHDRQLSPKSVTELDVSSEPGKKKSSTEWNKRQGRADGGMRVGSGKKRVVCKGTYKSDEVYSSLWGSSKAIDFRKRLEAQMKKKRNLLEKMHHKEFLRRQKMRRRAKEKRRALKSRDPSKISGGDDDIRLNKAYDLRVYYNKQLPMMPGTMQLHFAKFKKPPFNTYVTTKKVCTKHIDEFEKLRVPKKK